MFKQLFSIILLSLFTIPYDSDLVPSFGACVLQKNYC